LVIYVLHEKRRNYFGVDTPANLGGEKIHRVTFRYGNVFHIHLSTMCQHWKITIQSGERCLQCTRERESGVLCGGNSIKIAKKKREEERSREREEEEERSREREEEVERSREQGEGGWYRHTD
jgi:hypothetical protein